ncbi:hypothetical protein [Natrarchaeobaculum sulfurireducens]|uniref:Tripartite tricarboxylate transporter TctB family protein n=1 Tax=Natrarchaeobaculum sulfurireducens TaxID=2044521 RepID=A0A346PGG8_9EURY|nr:hypothetical protein [Natrarchaeobaculum sulfurireducens]AXR78613.1 hypothetical protein AArc1_2298 [Natrarchaeobaculum sulfurireducens]AXR81336.1 hypothetical protein AArcMg_1320 [Natrarchaeobaculum sulfurireducens]
MEHVLLLVFLGTAVYMFVESFSFGDRAAAFPRFTAGATIIGATLLLLRAYLPWPLSKLVQDTEGAFDETSSIDELEDETPGDETDVETPGDDPASEVTDAPPIRTDEPDADSEVRYVDLGAVWMHGTLFIGALTILFVVVSYLIGMLWTAPVFVAVYLLALRRPWYAVVGLSLLAFVAAFGFVAVLGIGIDSGALIDLGGML